jgi:lysophospholipase L1-like esterase
MFRILLFFAAALPATAGWVTTWSTGVAQPYTDPTQLNTAHLIFNNQTLRQVVHISLGSDMVRVRISNVFGAAPLEIGAAHIATRTTGSSIDAKTDHKLTFSGRASVIVPPNAVVISDPLTFDALPMTDQVISLFFPNTASGAAIHYGALQTNYIGAGDQTSAASIRSATSVSFYAFLAGLDVTSTDPNAGTIVTLGDSITDGSRSTSNTNHRWPNLLAARLLTSNIENLGVANVGISGNRVLHDAPGLTSGVNALARFGHDVLEQPNVKYILILEGINDLGQPGTTSAPISEAVTADDVIAGLQQLADRAHELGIKVIGCTLTPFAVATNVGYYSPERDADRQAINAWIRSGAAFDAVVDFEMAVRDPDHPDQFLAAYDSGDHLHPNNDGYQAMADAIDLTIFQQQ